MCGFSGNVETFRDPLRYSVGALLVGRIERVARASVLVSIVLTMQGSCIEMRSSDVVFKVELRHSVRLSEA